MPPGPPDAIHLVMRKIEKKQPKQTKQIAFSQLAAVIGGIDKTTMFAPGTTVDAQGLKIGMRL
jgi:hypothetical protein